jgi:hypothetical protein
MEVDLVSSPQEYFRELVGDSVSSQHLVAKELTLFYITSLLSALAGQSGQVLACALVDEQPMAIRLVSALATGGTRRRRELRLIGDSTLLACGLFPDHFRRSLVDIGYYVRLGQLAYGNLGTDRNDALNEAYSELADKFVGFRDVLEDVGEKSHMVSTDLLRLYETYLTTCSRRAARKLAAAGITPNDSLRGKLVM